jgi:deoxyribodipyrimidine photolyase-related protein
MMLSDSQPEGGKWNFDQHNRKKWKGEPSIPSAYSFANNAVKTVGRIKQAGVETIGRIDPDNFDWPVNRDQSLKLLDYFCDELLEYFGDYQDAMHSDQHFLFHSRLSFALNCKMLHPREVIDKVIETWRQQEDRIAISQVEGFVRQILGWREFMRGIYWCEMPEYENLNELDNSNTLPEFFWSGETRMNCLKHAIDQSLEDAYAHHIQRLMITGNFALLAQCNPDEVDRWYLGIYADAIQWVQLPNTRGMSQFADGGIVATKPYVSSANYINKMSNYCGSCVYNHKEKITEDACPFNSLYWNFLDEKKTFFKENRRMGMMLNLLEKKSAEELSAIKKRAQDILSDPSRF